MFRYLILTVLPLTCLLTINLLQVHAQNLPNQTSSTFKLSGKIIDTTGGALSHATVRLIADKDTLTALTDDEGYFSLKNLPSRELLLLVTMEGYLPYNHSISLINDSKSIRLKSITLKVNYNVLAPVTVKRSMEIRPYFQGDTLTYNTSHIQLRPNASVEELLRRLPGLQIGSDGSITINGQRVQRLLVDREDLFA